MAKRRRNKNAVEKAPVPLGQNQQGTTFMNLSGTLTSPRRGTKELLDLYSQSPWLRAIVSKIAHSVAEISWFMVAKRDSKGAFITDNRLARKNGELRDIALRKALEDNEAAEITDHPLLDLLENGTGNPRLNGFGVIAVTQAHLDLVGEAFWMLEKDQLGIPFAAWPLPPSWVTKLPFSDYPYYEISAPGGLRVEVPQTEIIPFIDPDPKNPYMRGSGISASLDDELQIDEFAAKHSKSFFLNRARPDIIISGQYISPQDTKRLEQQWLSDHQGFWKAFKPLFFSQKIDVKELSQSFESMQMVQIRKHERDTFISVFGAPPEKFGIIGESKRSTIQAADYFWNKDIIRPRVEAIRRSLQAVLVPMFDERLIISYDTPVIQDDEQRLAVMKNAPWAFRVNEWRHEAGKPNLPTNQGDMLLVPLNSQLVPLADDAGLPLPAEQIEESHTGAIAVRGNVQDLDVSGLSDRVAQEVASALSGAFDDVKRIARDKENI